MTHYTETKAYSAWQHCEYDYYTLSAADSRLKQSGLQYPTVAQIIEEAKRFRKKEKGTSS